jgi:hypothetical protein
MSASEQPHYLSGLLQPLHVAAHSRVHGAGDDMRAQAARVERVETRKNVEGSGKDRQMALFARLVPSDIGGLQAEVADVLNSRITITRLLVQYTQYTGAYLSDAISADGRLVHAAAQAVDVAAVPEGQQRECLPAQENNAAAWGGGAYSSSAEQMSSLKSSMTTKSGK